MRLQALMRCASACSELALTLRWNGCTAHPRPWAADALPFEAVVAIKWRGYAALFSVRVRV
jgi:hypothetical protein